MTDKNEWEIMKQLKGKSISETIKPNSMKPGKTGRK